MRAKQFLAVVCSVIVYQYIEFSHNLALQGTIETPKYYEFMNPTLQALRDGGVTLTNEEIVNAVVTLMRLPDEVLERKQRGHNQSEVEYRLARAKSYLTQAGYLTQSEQGVWALTSQGTDRPRINERAIDTDIGKSYVARRKEKPLHPALQGVQETSAAPRVDCSTVRELIFQAFKRSPPPPHKSWPRHEDMLRCQA